MRRTASVPNLLALLRETLPEFLGSLSAVVVTTAAAAALRVARRARRSHHELTARQPSVAQE
ncbi:hypothetical protein [Streptomyces sp. NPDC088180]|uniref:hypothetical protein n=1 Tax=Streptomyces sp. NPDC088180 TaxID=3365837 RepID=UPI00380D9E25